MSLRPAFLLALTTATCGSAGCGAFRKHALDSGAGIPLDYVEEDFAVARSASDLAASPYALLARHLDAVVPCYGESSTAGALLRSALSADFAFTGDVDALAPLPPSLPAFPNASALSRAQAAFTDARKKPTELARALDPTDDTDLFVRVLGAAMPAPARLKARWRASLSRSSVVLRKADVRSVYARSLEPDNAFQMVVQCAVVNAALPDGTAVRHAWPVYAAIETSSLLPAASQAFSLRGDIEAKLAVSGFTFLTPESSGLVAARSRQSIRIQQQALTRDDVGKQTRLRTIAFREGASFHFTRYLAVRTTPTGQVSAFLSFQHGLAKAAWESQVPVASLEAQTRYLSPACEPAGEEDFREFRKGGIHHVDVKNVEANLAALGKAGDSVDANISEPVCVTLLPAANASK